jgi:Predicted transcriptional regulators
VEFCEKLQALRKERDLTQEELAEALYVSRTAISKWESGRGYPSIDSLKEISKFFLITIDELLSGEQIISIAEKENKTNISKLCNLLMGIIDIFTFTLIILPLYPNTVNGYIHSVNLLNFTETTAFNKEVYWMLFILLVALGCIKILMIYMNKEKGQKTLTACSFILSIITMLFLGAAREPYALTITFALLIVKSVLLLKDTKNK